MNESHFTGHNMLLNPPAIVVQAFDEERAIAECRTLIKKRDTSKAEYQGAIIALGRMFLTARIAMPGERLPNGQERLSPAFAAFVERCGLAMTTVQHYMKYARDPRRLERHRKADSSATRKQRARHDALREILAAYKNGHSAESIIQAIEEELNEAK